MDLRDHPSMIRKSGFKVWPPRWTTTRRDGLDNPIGEVGILEQVLSNGLFANMFFLLIQYQGLQYVGALHFDNQQFCDELATLLKLHIGRSIKEIGDLDLSHTL